MTIWDGTTNREQQGTYFLTTSNAPSNASLVSATPVATNKEANVAAYTASGIPETTAQTINVNYYLAYVNYPPTAWDIYDGVLGTYDLPVYFDSATETIRQHTPTTWANLLGPFLRYYLATPGSGYDINYSLSSGTQRGSTYTDTRVSPTGTGYNTRFVNADDYRTQEFPTGTASVISGNTKRFYISKGSTSTYSASANPSVSVNEGQALTFTLTTTNVANGATFSYLIDGITAADISSGSLTGSVTISGGTGSTTIVLDYDSLAEVETATCTFTIPGGTRQVSVPINDVISPRVNSDALFATADNSPNPDAIARAAFGNNGVATYAFTTFVGTTSSSYNWLTDLTGFNAADWEIYATVNAGTIDVSGSDAVDTWLDLSTSRAWQQRVIYSGGSLEGTIVVTIRQKSNTSNVAVGSITLDASGIA
jgi:hypothetical protein